MIALGLVVTVSAASLVLSLKGGSTSLAAAPGPGSAAAAPSGPQPGSAQARADLTKMQTLLNSGSASQQAALLPPSVAFVPGSGPVFPPGTTVTIRQGTFRSAGGPTGTVQAVLSDKTAVTLELHSAKGHWYLYDVKAGAQTSAKVTSRSAGPVAAQLLSKIVPGDVLPPNQVPAQGQIGQKTPVIFVHGFGESAANWSDGLNGQDMLSNVDKINGVMSLRFDYSGVTAEKWVDNPANGPALATYIKKVAQASLDGHGRGKVVIVAFSMGGLLTRYAATKGGVGGDIGMVITIGTPNAGSFAGDGRTLLCYDGVVLPAIADQFLPGICTQWDAASAMGVFSPQIWLLPKLPSSIPVVHAIAGDETLVWTIWSRGSWSAKAELPLHGDGVVPTWSALEKRSGGQENTGFTFTNPLNAGDVSVWHLQLKSNPLVIAKTAGYIQDYIAANPPAAVAPALGGDAFWLAAGGQWQVHGSNLVISRGPSGLTGMETWNAGGQIILGHAQLAFTSLPDGSLAGTYIGDAWYTERGPLLPGMSGPPSTPEMLKGQTITLVPVEPNLAKTTWNSDSVPPWPAIFNTEGNPYWCGADLALTGHDRTQYCGA
jgi:pimeloyl-ACP methyl ester carboxylesterase